MAAQNSSVFPADPIHPAAVATPTSLVLAANPVHQAAAPAEIYGAPEALPTEQGSLTALPPPPQAAPAMKKVQRQGASMAAPTPPQDPPVTKGGNSVVPMPRQKPAMTVPPRGGPVLAPLPFPARPPFPMEPPYFYDVAPPMMALQPPPAGYMTGQPLFPAGPPPLKRQRHDYFGYSFDMHDRYSLKLDLQFVPGPRSTDGSW